MKPFLYKSFRFSIPFIVYLVFIAVIDPYNYLNWINLNNRVDREQISKSIEPHLFSIIDYEHNPIPNIILGDSRSDALYHSMNHNTWYNLSYAGGSLKEMIQTFWWATEKTQLDTVLMGINLNLYNTYNKRFWVEETLERKKNFFSYAFSRYTFRSAIQIVKCYFTSEEFHPFVPSMSKEDFWTFQLKETAAKFYERFAYPEGYYSDLMRIGTYCREHGIVLIVWIPPNHCDFEKRTDDFGLSQMNLRFVEDMKKLGILYNFDYPSALTKERNNFVDPMHFNFTVGDSLLHEILTGEIRYAQRFGAQ